MDDFVALGAAGDTPGADRKKKRSKKAKDSKEKKKGTLNPGGNGNDEQQQGENWQTLNESADAPMEQQQHKPADNLRTLDLDLYWSSEQAEANSSPHPPPPRRRRDDDASETSQDGLEALPEELPPEALVTIQQTSVTVTPESAAEQSRDGVFTPTTRSPSAWYNNSTSSAVEVSLSHHLHQKSPSSPEIDANSTGLDLIKLIFAEAHDAEITTAKEFDKWLVKQAPIVWPFFANRQQLVEEFLSMNGSQSQPVFKPVKPPKPTTSQEGVKFAIPEFNYVVEHGGGGAGGNRAPRKVSNISHLLLDSQSQFNENAASDSQNAQIMSSSAIVNDMRRCGTKPYVEKSPRTLGEKLQGKISVMDPRTLRNHDEQQRLEGDDDPLGGEGRQGPSSDDDIPRSQQLKPVVRVTEENPWALTFLIKDSTKWHTPDQTDDKEYLEKWHSFRKFYIPFLLLLYVFNFVVVPMRMAVSSDSLPNSLVIVEIAVDVIFILILPLHLFMPRDQNGKMVHKWAEVRQMYVAEDFKLDLIGAVPLQIIAFPLVSSGVGPLWLADFARFNKLFYAVKFSSAFDDFSEEYLARIAHPTVMRIIKFIFIIIGYALWTTVPVYIVLRTEPAETAEWLGVNPEDVTTSFLEVVLMNLNLAAGRSFPYPITETQHLVMIVLSIMSVGTTAVIIAGVTSMVISLVDRSSKLSNKVGDVLEDLSHKQIASTALVDEIVSYYHHMFQMFNTFDYTDSDDFFDDLPSDLQAAIYDEVSVNTIKCLPLFSGMVDDAPFVRAMAQRLVLFVLIPGTEIVRQGEESDDMFFISKGQAVVLVGPEEKQVAVIQDGSFFGEQTLLFGGTRTATVVAKTLCQVYNLTSESFEEMVDLRPDALEKILDMTMARRDEIKHQSTNAGDRKEDKEDEAKAATEAAIEQFHQVTEARNSRRMSEAGLRRGSMATALKFQSSTTKVVLSSEDKLVRSSARLAVAYNASLSSQDPSFFTASRSETPDDRRFAHPQIMNPLGRCESDEESGEDSH